MVGNESDKLKQIHCCVNQNDLFELILTQFYRWRILVSWSETV